MDEQLETERTELTAPIGDRNGARSHRARSCTMLLNEETIYDKSCAPSRSDSESNNVDIDGDKCNCASVHARATRTSHKLKQLH